MSLYKQYSTDDYLDLLMKISAISNFINEANEVKYASLGIECADAKTKDDRRANQVYYKYSDRNGFVVYVAERFRPDNKVALHILQTGSEECTAFDNRNVYFYNTIDSNEVRGKRGLISGYFFDNTSDVNGIRCIDMPISSAWSDIDSISTESPMESFFMNSTIQSTDQLYIALMDLYLRSTSTKNIFVTFDAVNMVFQKLPQEYKNNAIAEQMQFSIRNAELIKDFKKSYG